MNPAISTFEELCAIKNIVPSEVKEEDRIRVQNIIDISRRRLIVQLKNELYRKADLKSHETLFKMICDEDDLKRFGYGIAKKEEPSVVVNPTIEIKCADPNIIDKINNL